ncbi:MAG: hypothetical protein JNJ59_24685 [Deltaproteobacteria bacterium]|jgi:hypothetical protein|nr:hypothetical protein [Deltaproteobacteria bacterium]
MWRTLPFCLDQSLRGYHHLFDPGLVRRSFVEPLEVDPDVVAGASTLFEELRTEGDLSTQRTRIRSAPDSAQRLFVRLYFDYLDGWVARTRPTLH